MIFAPFTMQLKSMTILFQPLHVLASTTETADSSLVLAAVLLSLVVVYFASKLGGELSNRIGLPPVLGELVGEFEDLSDSADAVDCMRALAERVQQVDLELYTFLVRSDVASHFSGAYFILSDKERP